MNQNTEERGLQQTLEVIAIEQGLSLIFDIFVPILCGIIAYLLDKRIKSITFYFKELVKKKSTPRLTIEEQTRINECLRYMLNHSYNSRVGLYWLNNPRFEDIDIVADSYSLWIEASDTEEYSSFNLSFGYVSLQLNTMNQSNIDFASYKDSVSGLVCQVWLRHRKTKSYGIYKIGNIGFIFLEQAEISIFKKLDYRFSRKYDPNYLEYCDRIREIVLKCLR
ncbi:MAG: hypothetical protein ACK52E_16425 [Aphanizomenon sp.]|jgi:hypothetical protein